MPPGVMSGRMGLTALSCGVAGDRDGVVRIGTVAPGARAVTRPPAAAHHRGDALLKRGRCTLVESENSPQRRREMILATTKVEDFDRFLEIFGTKGAEKRKEHGSNGS